MTNLRKRAFAGADDLPAELEDQERDLRAILNGGFSWSDQAQTKTVVWNDDETPLYVEFNLGTAPVEVRALGCKLVQPSAGDAGSVISGAPVTWSWSADGRVRVTAIGGLTSSTAYHVTLCAVGS